MVAAVVDMPYSKQPPGVAITPSSSIPGSPWFERGGGSSDVSYAGVFASRYLHGDGDANLGFRAALLAVPPGLNSISYYL